MTCKVERLKAELRNALIEAYSDETICVRLELNGYGFFTQVEERTAESLKEGRMSMRNISGKFID